jgi:hypothetical protein
MKDPKNIMYLGQDIQDKIVYLSQFPNDVLAAALLFTLANNLAAQEPETDEDFTSIVDTAGEEALSLADQINVLYNTKNITRH